MFELGQNPRCENTIEIMKANNKLDRKRNEVERKKQNLSYWLTNRVWLQRSNVEKLIVYLMF